MVRTVQTGAGRPNEREGVLHGFQATCKAAGARCRSGGRSGDRSSGCSPRGHGGRGTAGRRPGACRRWPGPGAICAPSGGPGRRDRAPRTVARLGRALRRRVHGGQGENTRDLTHAGWPEDVEQIDSRQEPGRNRGLKMSGSRKEVLSNALKAEVGDASVDLETLFTDDVVGWSPYVAVSGLKALAELAALREEAFSNVVFTFRGLDEVGNKAFAEWLVEADHTGPLVLGEDSVLEATGRHVQLPGVTVADFRDGKIRSFRTYFDDLSLIEQILGA